MSFLITLHLFFSFFLFERGFTNPRAFWLLRPAGQQVRGNFPVSISPALGFQVCVGMPCFLHWCGELNTSLRAHAATIPPSSILSF